MASAKDTQTFLAERRWGASGAMVQKLVVRVRRSLSRKGIDNILAGDVDFGKAILRDYIEAPVSLEKVGAAPGFRPHRATA